MLKYKHISDHHLGTTEDVFKALLATVREK